MAKPKTCSHVLPVSGCAICMAYDGTGIPNKEAGDQHIVLDLYRREDGGLRIAGRGDARGVIISAATPGAALEKLWPAMHALDLPITKHDY